MNKHSVTVNGQKFTRNSEDRVYTHAVASYNARQGVWKISGWAGSKQLADARVARETCLYSPVVVAIPVGTDYARAFDAAELETFARGLAVVAQQMEVLDSKGPRRDYLKIFKRIVKGEVVFPGKQ